MRNAPRLSFVFYLELPYNLDVTKLGPHPDHVFVVWAIGGQEDEH